MAQNDRRSVRATIKGSGKPSGAPSSDTAAVQPDVTASYGIGDLAREFDVTARTIRFYEDQGLVSPGRKGQVRVYTQRDRVRLKLILRGKRLGFSISEIGEMLNLYDAHEGSFGQMHYVMRKIRERRAALLEQRKDIEVILRELEAVETRCLDELRCKEAR